VSVEIRREILAELGRGDEIAVAERLKAEAVTLTTLLDDLPGDDRQLTAERVQEVLAATSPACESFLEVALPIVEYGKGVALEALPPALRRATLRTRAGSTDQTARRVASVPAIGRLIWALAAFALHCDRPAVLVALGRERIQVPFYDDVEPVLSLTALRHPDALERNAGLAFRDYSEWLSHLVTRRVSGLSGGVGDGSARSGSRPGAVRVALPRPRLLERQDNGRRATVRCARQRHKAEESARATLSR
jgi:hypothetical protein